LERRGSSTELDSFSVLTSAWGSAPARSSVFVELNNILNSEYSVLRDRQPGRELRIGALAFLPSLIDDDHSCQSERV
jgi:hypothetical protein